MNTPRAIRAVRPAAFTLVELLVVIAIVGILVAILLPAVQMVRSAARKTACSNQLLQIGLSIHNYESALQYLPVNQIGPGVSDGTGSFRTGYYSWLVPLLPFLEQSQLHQQFSMHLNNGDADGFKMGQLHPNAVAVSTRVPMFICPDDDADPDSSIVLGSANPAPGSYVGNAGWPSYATGVQGERATPGAFNGAISLIHPSQPASWHAHQPIGWSAFFDGTSNTALASERLIQTANSAQEIKNGDARLRSLHLLERFQTLEQIASQFSSSHTHVLESAHLGRAWASGTPLVAPTYLHVNSPNQAIGHYATSVREGDFVITPSSHHRGGVNLTMADGSTRFVADDIDRQVWWTLGSRDDGFISE